MHTILGFCNPLCSTVSPVLVSLFYTFLTLLLLLCLCPLPLTPPPPPNYHKLLRLTVIALMELLKWAVIPSTKLIMRKHYKKTHYACPSHACDVGLKPRQVCYQGQFFSHWETTFHQVFCSVTRLTALWEKPPPPTTTPRWFTSALKALSPHKVIYYIATDRYKAWQTSTGAVLWCRSPELSKEN